MKEFVKTVMRVVLFPILTMVTIKQGSKDIRNQKMANDEKEDQQGPRKPIILWPSIE